MPSNISQFMRRNSIAVAVAAAAGLTTHAYGMSLTDGSGDFDIRWDNTFKYQAVFRTEKADKDIWKTSPTGVARNPLFGQGDRSFDRTGMGLVSNRIDWRSEFDLVWKDTLGFRISGAAWYDDVYNQNNDFPVTPPLENWNGLSYSADEFSEATRKWHGRGGELQDAFVFANWNIGDVYGNVRIGRHTIFYGQALLPTGVAHSASGTMTTLDISKGLGSPGTEAKELFMPSNKISTVIQLTENVTLDAFYGLEYRRSRSPSPGSFWEAATGFTDDNEFAAIFPGITGVMPRAGITQLNANEPDDEGSNYGFNLQYYIESMDMEAAFIYTRGNKTNETNLVGDIDFRKFVNYQATYVPDSPLTALTGGWLALGLATPEDIALIQLDSVNGPAVAFGQSQWAFSDDLDTYQLSLSKEIGGISMGLDLSYMKNVMLRGDLNNMLFRFNNVPDTDPVAWLTNVQGLPQAQAEALVAAYETNGTTGNPALDGGLSGLAGISATYDVLASSLGFPVDAANNFSSSDVGPGNAMNPMGNVMNLVINGIGTLNTNDLWDGGTFIYEVTFTYLDKVTANEELMTTADASVRDGISTYLDFVFRPVWNQVFPGVDMTVPMSISYGLDGSSPIATGFAREGVFGIGTEFNVENRYTVGLRYTNRFGSADNSIASLLKDRDNIAFTINATF